MHRAVVGIAIGLLVSSGCAPAGPRSGASGPQEGPAEDGRAGLHCLTPPTPAGDVIALLSAYAWRDVHGGVSDRACFGPFADRVSAVATRGWLARRDRRLAALRVRPLSDEEARRSAGGPVFLGAPASLAGNLQLGPNRVAGAPGRDFVAVFYQDTFEGEPGPGLLWLLDGESGRSRRLVAWGFTFTPDARHVVVGLPLPERAAGPDPGDDGGSDATGEVDGDVACEARSAAYGVPAEQLCAATFEDGFQGAAQAVRPGLLDVATGRLRPLPLAGGGALAVHDGRVVALPTPLYFETNGFEAPLDPSRVRVLALDEPVRWQRLAGPDDEARALAAFAPSEDVAEPVWREDVGSFVARTASGSLGLLLVGPSLTVQPVRSERCAE